MLKFSFLLQQTNGKPLVNQVNLIVYTFESRGCTV